MSVDVFGRLPYVLRSLRCDFDCVEAEPDSGAYCLDAVDVFPAGSTFAVAGPQFPNAVPFPRVFRREASR